MESIIIGYLGADAKETEKGFSFPLAEKYREAGEEKTLWVNCFQNFKTNVFPFLRKGTPVIVFGEVTVDIYKRGDGDYQPSVTCFVSKIKLQPGKKEQ